MLHILDVIKNIQRSCYLHEATLKTDIARLERKIDLAQCQNIRHHL